MASLLRETDHRGVTTLTLNRPERNNAFDDLLIEELIDTLDQIESDDSIRVLLLRASGKSKCRQHYTTAVCGRWHKIVQKFDKTISASRA